MFQSELSTLKDKLSETKEIAETSEQQRQQLEANLHIERWEKNILYVHAWIWMLAVAVWLHACMHGYGCQFVQVLFVQPKSLVQRKCVCSEGLQNLNQKLGTMKGENKSLTKEVQVLKKDVLKLKKDLEVVQTSIEKNSDFFLPKDMKSLKLITVDGALVSNRKRKRKKLKAKTN